MKLLTFGTLAQRLECSERTLREMVKDGRVPPPMRISPGMLRWDDEVITVWIKDGCPSEKPEA